MNQLYDIPDECTLKTEALQFVKSKLHCHAQVIRVEQGQVWIKCFHHTTGEPQDSVLVYFNRKNHGYWFCHNEKCYHIS